MLISDTIVRCSNTGACHSTEGGGGHSLSNGQVLAGMFSGAPNPFQTRLRPFLDKS